MTKDRSLSNSALKAMRRAAQIARNKAAEKKIEIPIWRDGEIIFETPKKNTDQIHPAGS